MGESYKPLVRFAGIQKTYDGETLVVKNLDLDIAKGEFVTMLGPSGSGKTTCLMMLAGFETPTSGTITLDGRTLNNVLPHQRNIGMVFQSYALFPHMTVAENVAFPLSVRRIPKGEIADKVKRALAMVRLQGFESRRPGQLSGGQQQRVALARALVFEPQLVLMDEPLGALDKQLREHMQLEIKHIHETLGVTVVYVTHDQTEALTMSDRVAVFNDGVIQQVDPPDVLYERPRNSFVAGFIGENNALPGEVERVDGEFCAVRLRSGESIVARAVNIAGVGKPTAVSLRPERVALMNGGGDGHNRLTGTVAEAIYLGDHTRLRMVVAGKDEFMVKLPVGMRPTGVAPGATVTIACRAEDCHALDPI